MGSVSAKANVFLANLWYHQGSPWYYLYSLENVNPKDEITFKVIPLKEVNVYSPKGAPFNGYYFWAILEFARSIDKYIHNESVIKKSSYIKQVLNLGKQAFGAKLDE